MSEQLTLKWGTLKGYKYETEATKAALQKYFDFGVSPSVAMHHDTDEQKQALCEVIDTVQGEIRNDWTGETMSKEDAKRYVLEYDA